jgi:hypothetical protein
MENLLITNAVEIKIRVKHGLSRRDIEECFSNIERERLEDNRVEHKTDPVTQWFIAQNNFGKHIKVVFMLLEDGRSLLKTAYCPNDDEIRIYMKYAKPI